MTSMHPAALDAERLLRECDVSFTRRSGPGGQHRNKVETCVVLIHRPTGLRGEAGERRSQSQNREMAIRRLRLALAVEVRAPVSDPCQPSDLWRSRCRGGKIHCNPAHDDFPALLAEALDVVAACGGEMKDAAERLGCTPSQLTKVLKEEWAAMRWVNALRVEQGLHPLK